ncbi:MAG: hypothetical protein R3C24_17835 [Cyanobacteriota/Melainabacteria group bacterium]|nr:hypothetical protein [Candidatus Obscuribacterales bacterium]
MHLGATDLQQALTEYALKQEHELPPEEAKKRKRLDMVEVGILLSMVVALVSLTITAGIEDPNTADHKVLTGMSGSSVLK